VPFNVRNNPDVIQEQEEPLVVAESIA
jgi:hypothetical protein